MTDVDPHTKAVLAAVLELARTGKLGDLLASVPVKGLREAADVLRVGRAAIAAKIESLPPHRRPADVGGTDRPLWWWPSREACVAWWADLHRVEPPRPRTRKRPSVAKADGRSLAARLADLGR